MCNFFSFITVAGTPRFLDADWRKANPQKSGDSHSAICAEFRANCDRVNKYEFSNDRFIVDQINAYEDDSGAAEKWVCSFAKSDAFMKICLATVKQNVWAIQYISNPSEKVKLAAVTQDGWVIQFIPNPSEKVKLAAVKQNGYAIQFIPKPSEKVKLAAVKQNGYAIQFIPKPSEKVKLAAVK